jgi:hypothetical protein
MSCRTALLAGLLLVLVRGLAHAQAEPPTRQRPKAAESLGPPVVDVAPEVPQTPPGVDGSLSSPVQAYQDNPQDPYLTSWGSFLPLIGYDYYLRPHYVQVDALFLQRGNTANTQNVVQTNGTGLAAVQSDDFNLPVVAGPRIVLGIRADEYSAWEASYFGTHFWTSTIGVNDPNNLDLPGAVGIAAADFHQADSMAVTYRSQIHNAELNYIPLGYGPSVFAGFRYLNWAERLTISSQNNANQSFYDLNTTNNLFGAQLGTHASWLGAYVDWDLTGKAGIFGNSAHGTQRLSDANDTLVLRNTDLSGSAFSFIGEINVNAIRRLNAKWQARIGYNLILVTGLALAPDQLDFTNNATSGTRFDRAGSVFLHGANVGIDARW